MELTSEELELHIGEIASGEKLVFVEREENAVPIILRSPDRRQQQQAEFIRRRALKEAEELGLASLDEMLKLIKERNLFSKQDEDDVERLTSQLKAQRLVLAKTTRVPANRERLKNIIKDIQHRIAEKLYRKEMHLERTRERKAHEEKLSYLTWACTYDPNTENRLWLTYETFLEETDIVFRRKVFNEFAVYSYGLTTELLRYVARSNMWRVRYITAIKTSETLFGRSIIDYTPDQLALMYWSHFYQSVYEMLPDDRPSDEIIDDDEALDAYMVDWYAERNRDNASSRSKKQYGSRSAWNHQETLVTRSNPMYEDIQYSETLASKGKGEGKAALDVAPMKRGKSK